MPVDRNLLPELPGKPDWYVENAPQAVDRTPADGELLVPPAPPLPDMPVQVDATFTPDASPLEAPQFSVVGSQASHGKSRGKVFAKFRH